MKMIPYYIWFQLYSVSVQKYHITRNDISKHYQPAPAFNASKNYRYLTGFDFTNDLFGLFASFQTVDEPAFI